MNAGEFWVSMGFWYAKILAIGAVLWLWSVACERPEPDRSVLMSKFHLKGAATDRLTLCNLWRESSWVLKDLAPQLATGTVCQTCSTIAAKLTLTEPLKSRSAKA